MVCVSGPARWMGDWLCGSGERVVIDGIGADPRRCSYGSVGEHMPMLIEGEVGPTETSGPVMGVYVTSSLN